MESMVVVGKGGTSFQGEDGVNLFRAIALKSGLKMYAACGIRPNRAWSPSRMLAAAGEYTGKRYKRGQYAQAAEDLRVWIDAMRCAIPIEHR